jgi:hypothetical protein
MAGHGNIDMMKQRIIVESDNEELLSCRITKINEASSDEYCDYKFSDKCIEISCPENGIENDDKRIAS